MPDTADKVRTIRLERLHAALDTRLENAAAALDALVSELKVGEPHPDLWEKLHAAAARDDQELELAEAYRRSTADRWIKQIPVPVAADLLTHAADFSLGVLGDRDGAEGFLRSVIEILPDHTEAFERLERILQAVDDKLRLVDLYARVAATPPREPDDLARRVINGIAQLTPRSPLSDDACKRLVALVPASHAILDVLEAHCRKTDRPGLACALVEEAIERHALSESVVLDQRRRLIDLYMGDAAAQHKAITHVEQLLLRDPHDDQARAAAGRLLSNHAVAARAAAALQQARRKSQAPPA